MNVDLQITHVGLLVQEVDQIIVGRWHELFMGSSQGMTTPCGSVLSEPLRSHFGKIL